MTKNIAEYMLFGSSQSLLNKVGSWSRESTYYDLLGKAFKIRLFSFPPYSTHFVFKIIAFLTSLFQPFVVGIFKRDSFDLIKTKQFWGCWSAIIHSKISNTRLCIRLGYIWSDSISTKRRLNPLVYRFLTFIESWLVSQGDFYIFSSSHVYEKFKSVVKSKKYAIIPNGIDTNLFFPCACPKKYHFISVGRITKLKGAEELFHFIKLNPHLDFLVIGNAMNNSQYERLLFDSHNVEYIPHVVNHKLPYYYQQSISYVSFSKTEGSPKTFLEALSCGLLPNVSNIKAHTDVLDKINLKTPMFPHDSVVDIDELQTSAALYFNPIIRNFNFSMHNLVNLESAFIQSCLDD